MRDVGGGEGRSGNLSLGSISPLPITGEGFMKEAEFQPLGGEKPQPVCKERRQVKNFEVHFHKRL